MWRARIAEGAGRAWHKRAIEHGFGMEGGIRGGREFERTKRNLRVAGEYANEGINRNIRG